MKPSIFYYKGFNIYTYYSDFAINFAKKLIDKSQEIGYYDIFRDSRRAHIQKISYQNNYFVVKESKTEQLFPKNIFSIIIRGESLATLINTTKAANLGVSIEPPLFVIQKFSPFRMIKKSLSVTRFISNVHPYDPKYHQQICHILSHIHNMGFYHNDAKLDNFLVENDQIVVIDTRMRRADPLGVQKYKDLLSIEVDIPNVMELTKAKKNLAYYIAFFLHNRRYYLKKFRDIMRNKRY